ncbi:MAG TPA: hypothetical protein VIK20_07620, partial [Bacteroidales bacterium]
FLCFDWFFFCLVFSEKAKLDFCGSIMCAMFARIGFKLLFLSIKRKQSLLKSVQICTFVKKETHAYKNY